MQNELDAPTQELPAYPSEALQFVEVDDEGFAVYRRPPITPGHYRTESGLRIIVCAAE